MIQAGIKLLEKNLLPDFIIRQGIRHLLKKRLQDLAKQSSGDVKTWEDNWVKTLKNSPIAVETEAANEQHYEVPDELYTLCLGPRLKYSSAYYLNPTSTLAEAEDTMIELYCQRAQLSDGQRLLDLGCGWGSLSLTLAAKYPNSQITGFSNSNGQRKFILQQAKNRGIHNLNILTGNIITHEFSEKFDRILSVEMFEHMRNYELLLKKVSHWLNEEGKLFVHIFCHKEYSYPFEVKDDSDWMSKYFFTGGQMPAANLLPKFQEHLSLLNQWTVSGVHYQKTSEDWLINIDRHKNQVLALFRKTMPSSEALKWFQYWRVFFMSCAELFGYNQGREWFVSHYLWEKRQTK